MARNSSQGSALIAALFIVALVAIAATAMTVRLQQEIQRTRSTINADELYYASQEVIFWAMSVLSNPPDLKVTQPSLPFPKKREHDYPHISVHGELVDLQTRFNLNELASHPGKEEAQRQAQLYFYRLMKQVLLEQNDTLESQTNQLGTIVQATSRWVSDIQTGKGQDELDNYYLTLTPPYVPSHQPMQSISEFRLVRGVDASTYLALLPYLTALPAPAAINLNTASIPVLRALGDGLSELQAESIVQARGQDGLKTFDAVNEMLQSAHIPKDMVTLESSYFLCIATADIREQTITHYAILKRTKDLHGKYIAVIIHDSVNTL